VFDHVTIRAADREASERSYAAVLASLGIEQTYSGEQYAEWDVFSVARAADDRPVTRGLHIGFFATSRELVDEFVAGRDRRRLPRRRRAGAARAALAGLRGSFLLGPDGKSAEVVNHNR
jgi:catechol 2,3-dioxygenase-like lactoylglutathione lyase family enzyme